MRALWEWLSDPTNQKTMAFIGGGLVVVAGAVWTVYLHWEKKKEPPPSPQISASGGGIAAGGNVTATAQPGSTAVIATGDVNIGITLEQHHEFLKQREDELRAELARASREEKAVLEKQLGVVEQQLANLKESYQKRVALLQEHIVALEKLKGEFPEEVLAAAKAALAKGDNSKADAFFRQIEEKADAPIKQAAEAAYQRGRIAMSRIDYRTAYAKFRRATQLQPDNADYHVYAGNIAQTLGLYDEAIKSHETGLGLYRSEEGDQSVNVAMQWNNLGLAWAAKGEYDKAIGYYEKALEVDIATFGEGHPNVAGDWGNLGLVWAAKGEYDKAIGYHEKALEFFERSLGKDHPYTRRAQANLRETSEARAAKKP